MIFRNQLPYLEGTESFVVMEYYRLIWNRTYLVFLTQDSLIGIKVNGAVSTEMSVGSPGKAIADSLAIKGDLKNSQSYLKSTYLKRYHGLDVRQFKSIDKANFSYSYNDIQHIKFSPKRKWGMSYYPHDGRVIVGTSSSSKELIILGNQSGYEITESLKTRCGL